MIRGNIEGIRQSALDELEKLFDAELERDKFLPTPEALAYGLIDRILVRRESE